MYNGQHWTIRQLVGFGIPEDTNQRLRLLLEQGATGTNTVFDYATYRGYNSDDPFAEGDVDLYGLSAAFERAGDGGDHVTGWQLLR